MGKGITFDEAIDILKKDIEYGKVKVNDEMIGEMMDIFIPIPTLKLNKIEEVKPIKINKRPRIKNRLYKFNIFQ